MSATVLCGDCLEVMRGLESDSIDAIVTDPPYGLAFMGAHWDSFGGSTGKQTIGERQAEGIRYADEKKGAPRYGNSHGKPVALDEMVGFQDAMTPIFAEALRVAKPGAHLLCFGGTRTFHRMTCAIEDAGWEIRDCIMWVYSSGFPHGLNVGGAIDKALGKEREKVPNPNNAKPNAQVGTVALGNYGPTDYITPNPVTDEAARWEGWNTALKPAWEPIVVARKRLDGTIANNVMTHGTGAINVDACRVPTSDKLGGGMRAGGAEGVWDRPFMHDEKAQAAFVERKRENVAKAESLGRYPANLVHDGSDEVVGMFPMTAPSRKGKPRSGKSGNGWGMTHTGAEYSDSGSAARFFYCAKASKKDRNSGCENYLTWEQDQELTLLLEQSSQLLKDMCASGTPKAEDVSLFTESSGNEQTGLSQTEWSFITSTVTRLTTDLKTSNSSQRSNISESILDAIRTSEESGISLARLADKLRNLRPDSTKEETDSAINAVSALFDALCEIRKLARKGNLHPTIKPNALMRWLVKLVCPRGGVVLDPFCGSGSTGVACVNEGMDFVGIDRERHYCDIAERRIGDADMDEPTLW